MIYIGESDWNSLRIRPVMETTVISSDRLLTLIGWITVAQQLLRSSRDASLCS
jgi:hypothetical protein